MTGPKDAEQLALLLTLQRDLALEADIDVVLRRIAGAATTLLDAERATVYVVDRERSEVWSRVLTDSEIREIRLPLGGPAGLALEYLALNQELAQERLRVVKVTEETRHRLARDLHDGVAQTLANTAIGIEIAQRRARQDVGGAMAELDKLRERLVDAQKGLRDLLFALRT